MIIVIGSRKGGTGKTTLATNIACTLAYKKSVILVDADRQPSASEWCDERDNRADIPRISCIQKYGKIHEQLIDFNKRYDHVVVDCSGKDSIELRSSLTCADIVITPVRPSQTDLNTLQALSDIIEDARLNNQNMKSYGLLTMSPTNPQINEIQEAKEFLLHYPIFTPVNQLIYDRKIYRDCLADGRGVIESGNDKAADEIKGLMQEIFNGY